MDSDEAWLKTEESPNGYEAEPRDECSSYEPSETGSDVDAEHGCSRSPAANGEPSGSASPRKRPAEEYSASRPFKRQRGLFSAEYLDLLNRDIDEAAQRVGLDDLDEQVQLLNSQIGLTKWSAMEKKQFFEAVSRLGRHDLLGVAARIGTKSEVEVQQYLHLLQDSIEQRRHKTRRPYLEAAQHPAAVELSQKCCHAQEEAADAISLRQELREEQREMRKWGPHWNITASLAMELSQDMQNGKPVSDDMPKFARLFHLPTWLRLSENVFMNSSIPGNNWNYVDHKQPSMWATTLDDFHALAVSVTRRLVQSTLFISLSRIRAKKEWRPTTRDVVRKKDVEAAIASLNMLRNSHEMWRTSARRLRLDVFDEPPNRDDEAGTEEEEPMTYDQVEEALSLEPETSEEQRCFCGARKMAAQSSDYNDTRPAESADEGCGREVVASDVDRELDMEQDEEEYEINREAEEILWHTAVDDIRHVPSVRKALRLRIRTERWQEEQAERHDDYASYQAEKKMWAILQRKPPMELARVQEPGPLQKSKMALDGIYRSGKNWSSSLEFYDEWETLDAAHKEDEE